MVTGWLIGLTDGTIHNFMATEVSVNKKTHGVEILKRDEQNERYYVDLFPWHTVMFMTTLGKLERENG